jgi:hypothetical protein
MIVTVFCDNHFILCSIQSYFANSAYRLIFDI